MPRGYENKKLAKIAGAKGGRAKNPNKGFGSGGAREAALKGVEVKRNKKIQEATKDFDKQSDKFVERYEDL